MKKRAKKLSLNRETVRNLESSDVRKVAGGENTSALCLHATGCCASDGGTDCYPDGACLGSASCSGTAGRTC
jgi:hypothetical protein